MLRSALLRVRHGGTFVPAAHARRAGQQCRVRAGTSHASLPPPKPHPPTPAPRHHTSAATLPGRAALALGWACTRRRATLPPAPPQARPLRLSAAPLRPPSACVCPQRGAGAGGARGGARARASMGMVHPARPPLAPGTARWPGRLVGGLAVGGGAAARRRPSATAPGGSRARISTPPATPTHHVALAHGLQQLRVQQVQLHGALQGRRSLQRAPTLGPGLQRRACRAAGAVGAVCVPGGARLRPGIGRCGRGEVLRAERLHEQALRRRASLPARPAPRRCRALVQAHEQPMGRARRARTPPCTASHPPTPARPTRPRRRCSRLQRCPCCLR